MAAFHLSGSRRGPLKGPETLGIMEQPPSRCVVNSQISDSVYSGFSMTYDLD